MKVHTCMEGIKLDETSQKIIDATMTLIREKGYVAATTKDIAKAAGVNECTLFRKFRTKKDIVMRGLEQLKWRANISSEMFEPYVWNLQTDLEMMMNAYMERITPDFVSLSIGLRAPQIYDETAPWIMKIPQTFVTMLSEYFKQMHERGKITGRNYESMAMTVFSSTFGYTFLSASFQEQLTSILPETYVHDSVTLFIRGLNR